MKGFAEGYDRFPKSEYECPECGHKVAVAGWEYEAILCVACDVEMEWDNDIYHPMFD